VEHQLEDRADRELSPHDPLPGVRPFPDSESSSSPDGYPPFRWLEWRPPFAVGRGGSWDACFGDRDHDYLFLRAWCAGHHLKLLSDALILGRSRIEAERRADPRRAGEEPPAPEYIPSWNVEVLQEDYQGRTLADAFVCGWSGHGADPGPDRYNFRLRPTAGLDVHGFALDLPGWGL